MAEIESAKAEAGRIAAVEALRGLREGVFFCRARRYADAEARVTATKADLPSVAADIEALAFTEGTLRT